MFIYVYKNKEWQEKLYVNNVKVLPKNNLNSKIFIYKMTSLSFTLGAQQEETTETMEWTNHLHI